MFPRPAAPRHPTSPLPPPSPAPRRSSEGFRAARRCFAPHFLVPLKGPGAAAPRCSLFPSLLLLLSPSPHSSLFARPAAAPRDGALRGDRSSVLGTVLSWVLLPSSSLPAPAVGLCCIPARQPGPAAAGRRRARVPALLLTLPLTALWAEGEEGERKAGLQCREDSSYSRLAVGLTVLRLLFPFLTL